MKGCRTYKLVSILLGFISLIALTGCDKSDGDQAHPINQPAVNGPAKAAPDSAIQVQGGSSGMPIPGVGNQPVTQPAATAVPRYVYNPEGRRDPFLSLTIIEKGAGKDTRQPLERVTLDQVHVIGIVWGSYGYSAMVQVADGKGYTVRVGTRIGPSGVVRKITDNSVLVEEPYIDYLGEKKIRLSKLTLRPQQEGEE